MSLNNTDIQDIEERKLYEDNHLIIINKKSGEPVQGDSSGDEPLLEKVRNYLKIKYNKPGNVFCGLVHRIDRPVSGAVVFAKTSKALSRMNEIVKEREMKKIYWAIVEGLPAENQKIVRHFLVRDTARNKTFAHDKEIANSKRAELIYKVLSASEKYSLLEIQLITGRHHQIRAQLSALGHPIKGDLKYGAKRSNSDGSISLHARELSFVHPVSKLDIKIEAKPFNSLFFNILEEK